MSKEGPSPVPGWISDADIQFLQALVGDVHDGLVVEVGVALGRTTAAIACGLAERGCRHVCIDTFKGGTDPRDPLNTLYQAGRGRFFRQAFEYNARALGVWNNIELIEAASPEVARLFEDESIDVCFLDADHSHEAITADIAAWWPKIKPGGFLAGDDYPGPGVRPAVDELVKREGVPATYGFRCWAAERS